MVFSIEIEESNLKKERKISRMESKGSYGHGHLKNREKSSGHGYSSTSRYEKSNEYSRPTCTRCGKKHEVRYLSDRYGCDGYGESGHMMKDCPTTKANVIEDKQFDIN